MASCSKSRYFGLYLVVALQNGVVKWSQTWIGMFLNRLTISSDSTRSVKAVDPRNKKDKEEEEVGEMGIFYNQSKLFKLVQFILIIVGTSKKH